MVSTRVLTVDSRHPDTAAIAEAARVLADGGLVAFPTETVYGLGAHALDTEAVERIFRVKGRPATDPLIVHVGSLDAVARVAREMPPIARDLAARFWPGPLTLVLPKRSEVPAAVTAGLDTVGVRVPAHPVARALLAAAGAPVAAPSANRFARPSPTRAAHVLADLDGRIDLVLDAGSTEVGVESTVLDLTADPPVILRPGGVTLEELRGVLPTVVRAGRMARADEPQLAPGQMLRHYAPRAPLTTYEGEVGAVARRMAGDARALMGAGDRVGVLAPEEDLSALAPLVAAQAAAGRLTTAAYGARRDPARAARELFDAMRRLDETGVARILAVATAPEGLGLAIRDRLRRAAEGRVIRVE
jgi:L-threonylcarbamoyladenylate synthase